MARTATHALIHLENLRHNIRLVRRHVGPQVRLCMAVKADAYGHGAPAVARVAEEEGIDCAGVARVGEGAELRRAGIRMPLLLLGLPIPDEIPQLVASRLTPLVGDLSLAEALSAEAAASGTPVSVHLKVDTGMGRIGCSAAEAPELAARIVRLPGLSLAGLCTHFPVSDGREKAFTRSQVEALRLCAEDLRRRGLEPGILHAANSGAVLDLPEAHLDMVRPGILLYGYYPSRDQERHLAVKPLMELKTSVVFLKRVEAGTPISYGSTYRPSRATVIATLPVGYADGYSRALSNRADVLIRGRRYPVVGRICMDQCLVDVGPDPEVARYDEVTLFGPDPRGPSAEELAERTGTISYEITCLVSKRVPRVTVDAPEAGASSQAIPDKR